MSEKNYEEICKELEFDETSHIYTLNGIELPSVTTLMQPLSNYEYNSIDERVLANAAERGTAVHNCIENLLKFDILDISLEHKGYVDAFVDFREKMKPKVFASEIRCYHKLLMYAGTVDLLCEINGKLTLIDYKTTSVLKKNLCGVQLEAYSKALSTHGVKVEQKAILLLKKTGTWDLVFFPAEDAVCWTTFGSLKNIYDYIKLSA